MRCLFAVSSWFVQRASLTISIDLSDVTNKYFTVLYCTVVVYEKKNPSLVFSGERKIPTLGSTVQWEPRQASFPTGTVGPRFGFFCPHWTPMMDSFHLACLYKPVGTIKERTAARRSRTGRKSIRDIIVVLKLHHHVASQRIQDFLEVFFMLFLHVYEMRCLVVSQKKNPLFAWGWYRKICPSRSLVITWKA